MQDTTLNPALLEQDLQSSLERFYHWEKAKTNEVFLRQPYGNIWKTITFAEAGQEARKMVNALQAKGLQKGDHIGILSKNCYHWILADLAIMMGGFVSVPFYASLPAQQLETVIEKSDIKLLFVGKLDEWENKKQGVSDDLPIIHFPHYQGNPKVIEGESWDDLIEANPAMEGNPLPDLDDLWTILFTSGTTGTPKGVMHTHRTPAKIMRGEQLSNFLGIFDLEELRLISYLPLNHVGERIGLELPAFYLGGSISFGESIDTFAKNLQDTQPTLFFAVPRIWTKFYQGVIARIPQKRLDLLMKLPLISGFIKNKIRKGLGLKHAKIVATGAAITPEFLKLWYKKLGVHLIEAYGMTEVCGSIVNSPDLDTPLDAVGRAVPFCEVKIDSETGEVLMKSPFVMAGYYNDPEKTAEVLKDGWVYSGDRGTIDEKGFVRVIGRVKDAFKTAKGKYVTPNPIEEDLLEHEYIEQACVVGLGIPQPIALINLSEEALTLEKETIQIALKASLQRANQDLAAYQKISNIVITKDIWSEENRLLTPTLKIRRGAMDEKYKSQYLTWQEHQEDVIWE